MHFQDIEQDLQASQVAMSAAEVHGLLCGYICAGSGEHDRRWQSNLSEDETIMIEVDSVTQLYSDSFHALQNPDLSFALLLPEDSEKLQSRALALTQWCQGLLSGVVLGGGQIDAQEEIKEIVTDLSAISQLDYINLTDDSAAQQQFFELSEHVRVSTLLLHSLLQSHNNHLKH